MAAFPPFERVTDKMKVFVFLMSHILMYDFGSKFLKFLPEKRGLLPPVKGQDR